MTTRSTFVGATLLAALATLLFVGTGGRLSIREMAARREVLLPFDPAGVERIELNSSGIRTVLQRVKGTWVMTEPQKDLADITAVRSLLNAASSARSFETIELQEDKSGPQLREFGLASGKMSLKIIGADGTHEIWFGKETAIDGRQYVRVPGTNLVDVATTELAELVEGGSEAFRNKFLFQIEAEDVTTLRWSSKKGLFELILKDGEWQIIKPERARADRSQVRNLLFNLTRARLEEFLPETYTSPTGETHEGAVVEIENAQGLKSRIEGIAEVKGRLVGRLLPREAGVALPAIIGGLFELTPRDFREKSLLRFDPDTVDVMRIEQNGKVLSLSRQGEKWQGEPGDFEADPELAVILMRMLSTPGLAQVAGDTLAEVPDAGFDSPTAILKLFSKLSEDSIYAKAGEHLIASVRFGRPTIDGRVYAATDAEPFVFTVPPEIVEYAVTDSSAWLNKAVLYGEPEDVTWIEGPSGSWRITRSRDNRWIIKAGRGVLNVAAAETLARALARLRALAWLDSTPEETKKPPTLSLRFGWDHPDQDAEETHLLEIWAGPHRNVGRLGREGKFFTLARPMTELLQTKPLSN